MPDEYRRTAAELVTRYKLEASLRDLYVEGDTDRAFFEWFCAETELHQVQVYRIDSVSISEEDVERAKIPGHRGKVVALSMRLDAALPKENKSVLCLVDKDLDAFFEREPKHRFLAVTDFTCAEMYAATPESLRKLFSMYMRTRYSHKIFSDIKAVLVSAFLVRAARDVVIPEAAWIKITNCCNITGAGVTFAQEKFIGTLLNASGQSDQLDRFEVNLVSLRDRLSVDVRENMHGHDFVELLRWYGSKKGAGTICSEKAVTRALYLTLKVDSLMEYALFQKMVEWASAE